VALAGISGLYCLINVPDLRPMVVSAFLDMTGAAFSFIFGERIYFRIKGN